MKRFYLNWVSGAMSTIGFVLGVIMVIVCFDGLALVNIDPVLNIGMALMAMILCPTGGIVVFEWLDKQIKDTLDL